jgi:hypothetical protein
VWADPVAAKRLVGVLPDGLALPERLTGRELLNYLGLLRGLDQATVAARAVGAVAGSLGEAVAGHHAPVGGRAPRAARGRTAAAGQPAGWERLLPASPTGAVVAKELRAWRRDPGRSLLLLLALLISGLNLAVPALAFHLPAGLPWVGLAAALIVAMGAANLYGDDGTALWLTRMVPGVERADVRGRQAAWLLVVAPVMVALTVSLTAFSGQGWAWPWVLATLPAMLGATAGLGVLLSVTRPVRQKDPNRRTGPFDTGDDPNAAGALIGQQYLLLVLAALAAVPAATLVLLGGLRGQPQLDAAGVVVGVATGGLLFWWGGRVAARRLADRGAELMDLVHLGPQARTHRDPTRPPPAAAVELPRWKSAARNTLWTVGILLIVPQGLVPIGFNLFGVDPQVKVGSPPATSPRTGRPWPRPASSPRACSPSGGPWPSDAATRPRRAHDHEQPDGPPGPARRTGDGGRGTATGSYRLFQGVPFAAVRARPSGRSCQRLDRRRGDDPFDLAHQFGVEGDERIRLQLGECDVLGVVGLGPPQLVGELPGPTPEDGVAEEADRQRPDAGEPVEGDIRRDLALVHGLVQGRQRLGAQQRRRKELVLGRDLDPFTRQLEDDAAVDDESGHLAVTRGGHSAPAGPTAGGSSDGLPGRQQQHRAQDRADDAAWPQRQPVPAEQADEQAPDERPGQADDQELGPVDGLVASEEQVRDPAGEHAPHEDEQQDHRCSLPIAFGWSMAWMPETPRPPRGLRTCMVCEAHPNTVPGQTRRRARLNRWAWVLDPAVVLGASGPRGYGDGGGGPRPGRRRRPPGGRVAAGRHGRAGP